jgi:hypothetical protein
MLIRFLLIRSTQPGVPRPHLDPHQSAARHVFRAYNVRYDIPGYSGVKRLNCYDRAGVNGRLKRVRCGPDIKSSS